MWEKGDQGTDGMIQSDHPLSGSAGAQYNHAEHRQKLFGDVRDVDLGDEGGDPEDDGLECPDCGKLMKNERSLAVHQKRWCEASDSTGDITGKEARSIFRRYWTTEKSQLEVAREFDRSQHAVSDVTKRHERFEDATEPVAEELGYPEQMDWPAGQPRKVEP